MAEYDNTNSGVLFRNERKETEKHPDYTGSINVDGTDYWLSAWLKTSKAGKKFFSMSVKPKDAPPVVRSVPAAAQPDGPFSDDIPFRQRHWQS